MRTIDKKAVVFAIIAVILFTVGNGIFIWHCETCGKTFFGKAYNVQDFKMEGFSFSPNGERTICEDCARTARILLPVSEKKFEILIILGAVSAVVAVYFLFNSFMNKEPVTNTATAADSKTSTAATVNPSVPIQKQTRDATKAGATNPLYLWHGEWVCKCGKVNDHLIKNCECGRDISQALSEEAIRSSGLHIDLSAVTVCKRCNIARSNNVISCPYCGFNENAQ